MHQSKLARFFLLTFCFILLTGLRSAGDTFIGYATASVNESAIKSMRCYGWADKEKGIPYDTATVQNIGSVSKTFIGLSLMIAVDRGLIDLDKDINDYLDFTVHNPHLQAAAAITLRHLATHTSGIVDNHKFYKAAYVKTYEPGTSMGVYLKNYLTTDGSMFSSRNYHASEPGTRYEYSNIGATLAAYVLETAVGVPFDEFTRLNILEPLGMKRSGWAYSQIDLAKHATLYDKKDKPLAPYTLVTYPDGGFRTCIADLAIYLKELINGYNHQSTLLSDASWDELFRKNFGAGNTIENIDEGEPDTGIFMIYSKAGKIGHTGSDPGASSIIFFDPASGEGRIFMANGDVTPKNMASFKSIWASLQ